MTKVINTEKPLTEGYKMPAEWEPHEATWIVWPHKRTDWLGKMALIPWVFGEMVRKITPSEQVNIIVNSESEEIRAGHVLERIGVDLRKVSWFRISTDRSWIRDLGPIFVKNTKTEGAPLAIVGFGFNGWAKYEDWQRDALVSREVAGQLGVRLFDADINGRRFVLEGGSIEVNGSGAVMTTEECLLDPDIQVRNLGASKKEIEEALCFHLGVHEVLWLGKGIVGDDTHGHVDDICRFVNHATVVLAAEQNPDDDNYALLAENYERLQGIRLKDGSKIEVVKLPMPAPLYFDGRRLPASYANFYICNSAVLVPTFNDPNDRIALGILTELFQNRKVVGIHAVDLVWGLGTIHCLTQQQPAIL